MDSITNVPELAPEQEEVNAKDELTKMTSAMESKVIEALDRMLVELDVTSKKFLTFNGFARAYDQLKEYNHPDPLFVASIVAMNASDYVLKMKRRVEKIKEKFFDNGGFKEDAKPDSLAKELANFCDSFFDPKFVENVDEYINTNMTHQVVIEQVAQEAIRISLCTQVGSAAQDISDFIMQALAEIEKVEKSANER